MTAQAPDLLRIDGRSYAIAGVDGTGLFDPDHHRLRAAAMSTACWRGYICAYAVQDDALVLHKLLVGDGSKIDRAPVVAGTELLGTRAEASETWAGTGYIFRPPDARTPFTGGLLLGDDFVRETYVHMGFHPAWKYARVLELELDNGVITARHDRSEEFAALRGRVLAGELANPDGRVKGIGWVRRAFTLDYTRSYGKRDRS